MKKFICIFLALLLMTVMQEISADFPKETGTKTTDVEQDDDSSSNNGNGKSNQDKKR